MAVCWSLGRNPTAHTSLAEAALTASSCADDEVSAGTRVPARATDRTQTPDTPNARSPPVTMPRRKAHRPETKPRAIKLRDIRGLLEWKGCGPSWKAAPLVSTVTPPVVSVSEGSPCKLVAPR